MPSGCSIAALRLTEIPQHVVTVGCRRACGSVYAFPGQRSLRDSLLREMDQTLIGLLDWIRCGAAHGPTVTGTTRWPSQGILNTLVDREAYRVCPLLSTGSFVSFCRARKVNVQAERLRQLEGLGLFLPMLRTYRIGVPHKVEYVDDGRRFRDLGQLGEKEAWDGAVRTELAGPKLVGARKRVGSA
jgi:hypothetical protein